MSDKRKGVTLVVGFLGAGKTTLVNQLIKDNQGLKLALIENEFGELGVDNEFLPNIEELVLEMNDGCLCCSVRGDMVQALKNLINQEQEFDHLIIEATGMASPGPILESFKKSRELEESFRINTVISLVDAIHFDRNMKRDQEEEESNFSDQLAFSDLILLNKTEGLKEEKLLAIENEIIAINPDSQVCRTNFSKVNPSEIFERNYYDPKKVENLQLNIDEGESFAWAGLFDLPVGKHHLYFNHIHHSVNWSFLKEDSIDAGLSLGRILMSSPAQKLNKLEKVMIGSPYTSDQRLFELHVLDPGKVVFFLDDHPSHLQLEVRVRDKVQLPLEERGFTKRKKHAHGKVNSVSIEVEGELDPSTFQFYLNSLFMKYPDRIYRSKGILCFPGNPHKVFFQGVYENFDFSEGPMWTGTKQNRVVFIGMGLNADLITSGFKNCLIKTN
jgi:G3E family GTPase